MTAPKPTIKIQPRVYSEEMLARRFNRSPSSWSKKRKELEREGFPHYDELLGGTDIIAAEHWIDLRSGLNISTAGENDYDKMIMERLLAET